MNGEEARLLQEEIDRRLANLRNLMDERRDNIRRELDGLEKLNIQRSDDLKELMITGQAAAKEAVQAALTSAKEAVVKAETASEKRFEGVNEFRKALSDQTGTFIPRAEYSAANAAVVERIGLISDRLGTLELRLTSRLDRGEGADTGVKEQKTQANASMVLLVQVIVAVIAVAAVIISVVVHVHLGVTMWSSFSRSSRSCSHSSSTCGA